MTIAEPENTPRYPRGAVILVTLAGATVAAFGMAAIRDFLAPVLLTLILSICAHPVRVALEKRGVGHGLATGSVILTVFALLAGFVFVFAIALGQFAALLPEYADELDALGAQVGQWVASIGFDPTQVQAAGDSFEVAGIGELISGLLGGVATLATALVVVLTTLIVMSADATYIPTVLKQLKVRRPHLVPALGDYAHNVRRYMIVTALLGIAQGVLCAVFLTLIGVPAALLWGLLLFLCSFIPNIGFFIAIIPPLIFGLLVGGWPAVLAIVVYYGVVNGLVQTVIQPRVVSNAVSISQTLTFVSVLIWAAILGPLGAILAIPLTLLVRAVFIDANPEAKLWRPALGDIRETKNLLKAQDEADKSARTTHKAQAKAADTA
jgi:predicted PurR-regulated permease PerM